MAFGAESLDPYVQVGCSGLVVHKMPKSEPPGEQSFDIIETVVDVAERNHVPPATVAIAWTSAQPFVTAPIAGANRPEQLRAVLDHVDFELHDADLALLNRVSDWPPTRTHLEQ